jgi:ethanolamine ammonia-lyase large subunit
LYADVKACIHARLPQDFAATLPSPVQIATLSRDREDYILHPPTGEMLDDASTARVRKVRDGRSSPYDVQIVVSDGLNVYALTDAGHLAPYLEELRRRLVASGLTPAPDHFVVTNGRVRAGYRIGDLLFHNLTPTASATVVHIIGERPGNGHHTFSAYVTRVPVRLWAERGVVDHNHTKVISNIADTALNPVLAAQQTVVLLKPAFPLTS